MATRFTLACLTAFALLPCALARAQERLTRLELTAETLPEGFVFDEPDDVQREQQGLLKNPMWVRGREAVTRFIRRPGEERLYGIPEGLDQIYIALASPPKEPERVLIYLLFDMTSRRTAEWIAPNARAEFGEDCRATLVRDDLLVVLIGSGVPKAYVEARLHALGETHGFRPFAHETSDPDARAVELEILVLDAKASAPYRPIEPSEDLLLAGMTENPITASGPDALRAIWGLSGFTEVLGDLEGVKRVHFGIYAHPDDPARGFSYILCELTGPERAAAVAEHVAFARVREPTLGPLLLRARKNLVIVAGFQPEDARSFFWLSRLVDDRLEAQDR